MKKLISKETNNLIKNCYIALSKLNKAECVKYDLHYGECVGIGRIIIHLAGKDTYLFVDDGISKEYMKEWKNDIGSIIVRDAKKENYDPYYTFTSDTFKALLRRVDESEIKSDSFKDFVSIELGDYFYIVLKIVKPDQSFIQYDRLTEELPEKEEDPDDNYSYEEELKENEIESLSLFE